MIGNVFDCLVVLNTVLDVVGPGAAGETVEWFHYLAGG